MCGATGSTAGDPAIFLQELSFFMSSYQQVTQGYAIPILDSAKPIKKSEPFNPPELGQFEELPLFNRVQILFPNRSVSLSN
jgi:hypothetical protein